MSDTKSRTSNTNGIEAEDENQSPQWYQERAEKNRQRALLLRQSKLVTHPHAKEIDQQIEGATQGRSIKLQGQKVIDTGGGFLIEEDDELEQEMLKITEIPAPIVEGMPKCEECHKEFKDSDLLRKFDYIVCDSCRDPDDKHSLITKTEAKEQYLLKDCDFDKREPELKYIARENPHNKRFGEMKLYLHLQVEKRALEVWKTEEALREALEKRDQKRQETKVHKFNKKIKQLRMNVRSSLYDRTSKAAHVHKYGPDTYNEDDDTYTHFCVKCNFEETYEKM